MRWLESLLSLFLVRLNFGGGGGGGGETRFEWNDSLRPYYEDTLLPWVADQADNEYLSYMDPSQLGGRFLGGTGMRTPGVNNYQTEGINQAMSFTRGVNAADYNNWLAQGGHGSYIPSDARNMIGANQSIADTMGGAYLGEGAMGGAGNPYMGLTVAGMNPYIGGNPNMDQNTMTERNVFSGQSPYFLDTMRQGMQDISDMYKNATEPSLRAAAVLNGTLGGGDHMRLQGQNEDTLARNLSRYADNALQGQYQFSAGLEDSFLNRDIQNQQFNKGQNAGLYESMLGRGSQSFNLGLDRGMTGWENERNRMMGAIPLAQGGQGLAFQRSGQTMGIGDFQRGVEQQYNDELYNDWFTGSNWGKNQANWLASILSGAQGGLPPTQFTSGVGGSGVTNGLGAALAAYGLFRN